MYPPPTILIQLNQHDLLLYLSFPTSLNTWIHLDVFLAFPTVPNAQYLSQGGFPVVLISFSSYPEGRYHSAT